jgi:hypothetical protein
MAWLLEDCDVLAAFQLVTVLFLASVLLASGMVMHAQIVLDGPNISGTVGLDGETFGSGSVSLYWSGSSVNVQLLERRYKLQRARAARQRPRRICRDARSERHQRQRVSISQQHCRPKCIRHHAPAAESHTKWRSCRRSRAGYRRIRHPD